MKKNNIDDIIVNMNDKTKDTTNVSADDVAQTVLERYQKASAYMQKATEDFWAIYCAVNGIPFTGKANPKKPYISDMALASLVRQHPRYTIQKLPAMTAQINKLPHGAHTIIANYLLRTNILNENGFGKSLLQKIWLADEYAITYGFCAAYTPFSKKGSKYGAPFQLVPYTDIAIEPNVMDATEANRYFIVNWWQKSDIKRKIAQAEANPDSGWDALSLQKILDEGVVKNRKSGDKTNSIGDGSVNDSITGYKIISQFERGSDTQPGKITMIEESTGLIIKQQPIKSMTGYPRIMFLVIDNDWQQPFGRSRVKLAMPYHLVNTSFMRSLAYVNEYNINPARLIKGMRGINNVELTPGNDIDAGDNPNATVEPIRLETTTSQQALTFIQNNTSVIQNVFGQVGSGQVGAGTGNSGISRAPGWAKVAQSETDVNTTYNRRFLEDFIREYALNSLDVIISNFEGVETLLLDEQAISDIKQNNIQNMEIVNDNEYTIDWAAFREGIMELSVDVEYGSSVDEDKDAKLQKKSQIVELLKSGVGEGGVPPETISKAVNNLISDTMEDPDSAYNFEPQPMQPEIQPNGEGMMQ